jgi:hypothetical protein
LEHVSGKTVALRYGHIEAALAEIMKIEPDAAKAFHARLRHLRNIGVPAGLPTPGKGQAIKYTRQHAFEILIALSLQQAGQGPQNAGRTAKYVNDQYHEKKPLKNEGQDIFCTVYPPVGPKEDDYIHVSIPRTVEQLAESLRLTEKLPHMPLVTVINLTRVDTLLGEALDRQIYI